MSPAAAGQFGDTTYTKVFVGGLAWETQMETMKNYFEQFGDILEAVVIADKVTGRSKGYGFVTFREADAAMRACGDASPVIDGRRANCNIASLGVQRSKPSTPKQGGAGKNFTVNSSFRRTGFGGGTTFPSATTFPHYAIQPGTPNYNVYAGYASYSPDYSYSTNCYGGVYGGAQYPVDGGASTGGLLNAAAAAFYPCLQLGEGRGGITVRTYTSGQGYGVQYPHHLFQYPQHYGAPMSLAPTQPLQSGVTMALHAPPVPHR